jgi:hypothetical protein
LNNSHASRTGAILFGTANGSAPSERARITSTGNLLIGGTTDITGSGGLRVFGTTASTSITTGALQVGGGVGVAGALFVAEAINAGTNVGSAGTTALLVRAGKQTFRQANNATDRLRISVGDGSDNTSADEVYIRAANTAIHFQAGAAGTTETLTLASNGNATFASTTASTSTTTGALTVAGGVGVGGAAFFGGAIAIGNTVNTVTATLPNRTITIEIGGTTYYIHAKTTND